MVVQWISYSDHKSFSPTLAKDGLGFCPVDGTLHYPETQQPMTEIMDALLKAIGQGWSQTLHLRTKQ